MEFPESMGPFFVSREKRDLFLRGDLWKTWHREYPEIFDADDLRLAQGQASLGYHFYEWFAAIQLFEGLGYLSLVEKYQFKRHKRKYEVFSERIQSSTETLDLIKRRRDFGNVQLPDLFVYRKEDLSDWFFCEIKGAGDRMRSSQEKFFRQLSQSCRRPVVSIQVNLK